MRLMGKVMKMADPALVDPLANPAGVKTRVVDTDVHHQIRDQAELYPFLSRNDRQRLKEYGLPKNGNIYHGSGGFRGARADCFDLGEEVDPRTRIELFQKKLLDGCGIDRAILQGEYTPAVAALVDLDYCAALCRALNDWSLAHWIDRDPRFRLALTVPMQDPVLAAKEIHRLGDHPAVVAVYAVCGSPRLYGQRYYDPVYAACVEHGLAFALHFSNEGSGVNPAPTAAGHPSYYAETYLIRPQFYQAHLSSFIFEGTFEKFPKLKVAFLESGFGWVPSFRWRADAAWKALRAQTPWVKRLPSEYIAEHIRFSTQPFEDTDPPGALVHLLEEMDGGRTLMFASDFPHWDFDPPDAIARRLPVALRKGVLEDNAFGTYPKLT